MTPLYASTAHLSPPTERSSGRFSALYERYGARLAFGTALCLPLKLSLAYVFLLPLTTLWLLSLFERRRSPSLDLTPGRALAFFLLVVGLSGLCGLDPVRSSIKGARFAFYAATVFAFADLRGANVLKILSALVIGQTVAALHTIGSAIVPGIPSFFVGAVTESGQLALTFVVAIGILLALNRMTTRAAGRSGDDGLVQRFRQERRNAVLIGALHFFLLVAVSFAPTFKLTGALFGFVALAALGSMVVALIGAVQVTRLGVTRLPWLYLGLGAILPCLATALLVNLKRGPWLGVALGIAVFFLLHARRYLLPALGLALLILVMVAPLRTRLAQSSEHFFIAGGRQVIWEVGSELALRYPLGIGYENSRILRDFAPEIPAELVHFHNNFLQILVESGWFGLGIYLWWLSAVVMLAFRSHPSRSESLVCAAIGCAVIAWQTAGLVEYNLGDSEVALIAFLAIGLLMKLKLGRGKSTSPRRASSGPT